MHRLNINQQKEVKGDTIMGILIVSLFIGLPCALFLVYCLTPSGRKWMRQNNML